MIGGFPVDARRRWAIDSARRERVYEAITRRDRFSSETRGPGFPDSRLRGKARNPRPPAPTCVAPRENEEPAAEELAAVSVRRQFRVLTKGPSRAARRHRRRRRRVYSGARRALTFSSALKRGI